MPSKCKDIWKWISSGSESKMCTLLDMIRELWPVGGPATSPWFCPLTLPFSTHALTLLKLFNLFLFWDWHFTLALHVVLQANKGLDAHTDSKYMHKEYLS